MTPSRRVAGPLASWRMRKFAAWFCVPGKSITTFSKSARKRAINDVYLLRVEQLYPSR